MAKGGAEMWSKKQSNSRQKQPDFVNRLNEDERKREVNVKDLGLISWNDGGALTEMG